MSESVEGGAGLAWRLLATLEGGSLFLATTALLAYTATYGIVRKPTRGPVRTVLITNTTNNLGKILKQKLESCGCEVSTITSDATSGAGAVGSVSDGVEGSGFQVDALIVVGSEPRGLDLNGISNLVTEDVYRNLKLLEDLSSRVSRKGCIAWACSKDGAEAEAGAFRGAGSAFDAVIHTTLRHVAKVRHCEAVWVGRCSAERTADRLVAALMTCTTHPDATRFSVRNAAVKVGEYLYKCLKTIT